MASFFWRIASCLLLAAIGYSTQIIRFEDNPIIRPEMVLHDPVVNINGPSLIKVPEWLPHRLGNYYLYFANHRGPHIHLAYADTLRGPWKLSPQEPLSVNDVAVVNNEILDQRSHVASPDIYIDEVHHKIRMYFHFRLPNLGHRSSVAESSDGVNFTIRQGSIGKTYMRHWVYNNAFYFVDKKGRLSCSIDGLTNFEPGGKQIYEKTFDEQTHAYLRHTALRLVGNKLKIFFTRIGDAPESILQSTIKLNADWSSWQPSAPRLIAQPETIYEGVDLPIEPSKKGDAKTRLHQLRDPAIFVEKDDVYLLYAVAGENGIAIAKLVKQ